MFETILALAPHADDVEFGCGGSLSRWIQEGKTVYYVAFSHAEGDGTCKEARFDELCESIKILGIQKELIHFDYPVRKFSQHRQEILEDMINLRETIKPDLVVLPSNEDTHQDHMIIAGEGFRAYKRTQIIGYEMIYNNPSFSTDFFVSLKEEHINTKIKALQCYRSQYGQFGRIYDTVDCIRSLAVVRGAQIGVEYAEAFSMVRMII